MDCINLFELVHNFEYDESFNFDTIGCPDHCTGCGSCDHFPPTMSIECNVLTTYYRKVPICKKCHIEYTEHASDELLEIEPTSYKRLLTDCDKINYCHICGSGEFKIYYSIMTDRSEAIICKKCSNDTETIPVNLKVRKDPICSFCDERFDLKHCGKIKCE